MIYPRTQYMHIEQGTILATCTRTHSNRHLWLDAFAMALEGLHWLRVFVAWYSLLILVRLLLESTDVHPLYHFSAKNRLQWYGIEVLRVTAFSTAACMYPHAAVRLCEVSPLCCNNTVKATRSSPRSELHERTIVSTTTRWTRIQTNPSG